MKRLEYITFNTIAKKMLELFYVFVIINFVRVLLILTLIIFFIVKKIWTRHITTSTFNVQLLVYDIFLMVKKLFWLFTQMILRKLVNDKSSISIIICVCLVSSL